MPKVPIMHVNTLKFSWIKPPKEEGNTRIKNRACQRYPSCVWVNSLKFACIKPQKTKKARSSQEYWWIKKPKKTGDTNMKRASSEPMGNWRELASFAEKQVQKSIIIIIIMSCHNTIKTPLFQTEFHTVLTRLSFFLTTSTAVTYIFTAPTCTTTIITLQPCALNGGGGGEHGNFGPSF